MAIMTRLRSLLRNLIHRDQVDRDLDDELRATLAELEDEHRARGLTSGEARRAAAIQLGRVESLKEQIRDVRAGALLDSCLQDCRYGARVLRRNPLFTIAAVLSLAAGIGATTTIFTIANGLLLRVAPGVTDPGRLVDVVASQRGNFGVLPVEHAIYENLRERMTLVEDLYAYRLEPETRSLRIDGAAERVFAGVVTRNYFAALGVPAAAGRVFDRVARSGADPEAVVLSHDFWQRRFDRDPAIVGRTVHLNGRPVLIAGVAREGFRGLSIAAPDLWIAVGRDAPLVMIGGRLKPGVTRAQALAELQAAGRALALEHGGTLEALDWTVAAASPLPAVLRGIAATFVGLMLALVSLVLVIACANLAGVLLARATMRRREIAVRVAIGAGRARVIRQMITETLLLFVLGAAAGVALARVLTTIVLAALPAFPVPINLAVPLDARVLAFAIGMSLVSAVLCGLAPALHAARADVVSALKDESQGPSDPRRLRQAFVVAQVAVSILLVVAAGLLGRALTRITFADQGFDERGVGVASVDLSMAGYTEAAGLQFVGDLRDRVRRAPGVSAVAAADRLPGGPVRTEATLRDRGARGSIVSPGVPASWTRISPGYFATLRIPLVSGRDFTDNDRPGSQPVVIVDEATARRLWPGQEALGKSLPAEVTVPGGSDGLARIVVGVARNVTPQGRSRDVAVLSIYAPLQQMYAGRLTILTRTEGRAPQPSLRTAIMSIDPDVAVMTEHSLADSQSGPVVVQLRIAALVSGTVGIAGLLLASLGIYGVTAFITSQRTREIGIRLTLGARRRDVVWLIVRHGLKLVGIGSILGLSLAAVAARMLGRLLFGLPPLDPIAFGGAAVLFAGVGLAACYLPARRATRITAMEALRYE